ncbi:uncharacterized protein LOC129245756 [Anastrepha obliqua]|uniref:uncharacterized protein LOC129245756 n=1 Tax=Anastrepha obliqua TaxID=95512 RepID=UPI002409BB45|nr:uncharacterized protein LOC129245756 [Anastrepha obliqua]XP_054740110.1 uncharacterized protein LOC129245756 [Anastrepha obliqua]
MKVNKFYCNNETQCNNYKEFVESGTNETLQGIGYTEPSTPRNISNKAVLGIKELNGTIKNTNDSDNEISFMQGPAGNLQYQHRNLTPQEYSQSRMYYNASEYKCQDGIFSTGGNGRLGTASISPALQLEGQHYLTSVSQKMQSTPQHQLQATHNSLGQLHLHHKPVCNSNAVIDVSDEIFDCGQRNDIKERSPAVSTQTQYCGNQTSNNYEPIASLPSATSVDSSSGSLATTVASSHMMYTVHRVVTTAQIQTALGNTYTSSSVSSVVSALRNEDESMAAPLAASLTTLNGNCILNVNGCTVNPGSHLNNMEENSNVISNSNLVNETGVGDSQQSSAVGTNINVLPQNAQKLCYASDNNHSTSKLQNVTYSNANSINNSKGLKPSSSMPRPLQNVIPTCVYLMSRIAVHMEIEGTAHCPAQVMLAAALGCEELGIANKLLAQSIFGLWMTSGLLDIQLKSHHRPYIVRVAWQSLLDKFSSGNPIEKKYDEPMIMLKRNVFFSKRDEERIKDHRILELLYEEAKYNVLSGRYVMEPVHALMLGGIQARIELGPYNSHTHTISFLRENQLRFLPHHVAKSTNWSWLPVSRKNSAEVKLLEQFKRVPQTATTKKLIRKYLEFCWALPFYGAAFFHGQVEQPVRGLMSFVSHKDVEVMIAVNERGIFVVDTLECTLLLGLRYEDLSWDFAKPSVNNDSECLTCIFIQFDAMENGIQVSKLMQIFSKQAGMIDALISHFAEQIRKLKLNGNMADQHPEEPYPIQNNGTGVLCNKLSRLTLATFDDEGRCIGQTGSLSISY